MLSRPRERWRHRAFFHELSRSFCERRAPLQRSKFVVRHLGGDLVWSAEQRTGSRFACGESRWGLGSEQEMGGQGR